VDLDTVTEFRGAPGTSWQPGDAWLGGGTWLFSAPQPGLRRLLDLHAYGWPALTERPEGLEIAATCTISELAGWRPARPWPAARLAAQCTEALLASFKVQNVATVGGNICLALPAGAMTSLAAALDATALLWSADGTSRVVPAAGLVTGPGRTALRPGELLRSVTVPAASLGCRSAFRRASLSPHGRSAAVVIGRTAGAGRGTVITVTAATPRPVQLRFARPPAPDAAVAALDRAVRQYHEDAHGAPAWRAAMTRRYVAEIAAELAG
jgi:CO/xanthine dehydrogenase FAD-binding subunit